jgi:hypothetical protein
VWLPEGGPLPEVLSGLPCIDLDPVALLVDAAEGVECLGLALVGTPLEPGDREVLVRFDPVPVQQTLRLEPVLVPLVSPPLRAHLRGLDVVAHCRGIVMSLVVRVVVGV